LGYIPILILILAAPGFAEKFWWSIVDLLERKSTNISLPIPWPWLVMFGHDTILNNCRAVLIGIYFVAVFGLGMLGLIWISICKIKGKSVEPTFVAVSSLALPYAHYAFSRADIGHLALSIFPLLVGIMVLLSRQALITKWVLGAILGGTSILIMLPIHPGWSARQNATWTEIVVGDSHLRVSPEVAEDLSLLDRLRHDFASDGRSFLVTPFPPGAYAATHARSPTWEIYTVNERSEAFQNEEIRRVEAAAPGFVLILDLPLDGREELRFRYTHPVLDRYIRTHYQLLKDYAPNTNFEIFVGK